MNNIYIQQISCSGILNCHEGFCPVIWFPSPQAAKFAIDIFNFKKLIAEIMPNKGYLNDPVKVKMLVQDHF